MNRKFLMFVLLIGSLATTGCAVHEGHEKHVSSPTLGSELIDLQEALNSGAISDQEYHKLKEKLLNKRKQ